VFGTQQAGVIKMKGSWRNHVFFFSTHNNVPTRLANKYNASRFDSDIITVTLCGCWKFVKV
jgi:hypothetical protein